MLNAVAALKYILRHVGVFSRLVLSMPLRAYQEEALEAVIESVLHQQGHEFLLVFPRQAGKNEAVAHLLVYLLNILQRVGGNIVYAAIGDGLGRGVDRLEARLDNPWNQGRWRKKGRPVRRMLGRAAVVFLSSHPQAHSRGETAHWLLVVDELQDQDAAHLEAVFTPMRAANNATALYLGTVRTKIDALWQKKLLLEQETERDGVRRVFWVRPDVVTAENPAYGQFLAAQVRRHGRNHPTIAAEYFLEPLDGQGGLFPPRRRALMHGRHPRQLGPDEGTQPGRVYVATLDIAGQDEAAGGAVDTGRDYTVCTVFDVGRGPQIADGGDGRRPQTGDGERRTTKGGPHRRESASYPPAEIKSLPVYRAVDVFVDQGSRHFEQQPGRGALAERLLAYLRHWQVRHLVADASGVGEGLVDWLAAQWGRQRVTGYKFTPRSKAGLGSAFVALVETGRFQYWAGDANEPLSAGWWFWRQVAACTYSLPGGGAFETHLRWGVPASARVDTPAGRLPVHDDRLLSAALVAHLDRLWQSGRVRTGAAVSAIIPPAY